MSSPSSVNVIRGPVDPVYEAQNARRADIIIAVVVLVVGIIIVVILALLTWRQWNLYNDCNNNESPYCFQWACEQAGGPCGNNAIRYSADGQYYACSDASATWTPISQNSPSAE